MPIFASTVTTVVVFLPMFYRRHRAPPAHSAHAYDCHCVIHVIFVSRTVTPLRSVIVS